MSVLALDVHQVALDLVAECLWRVCFMQFMQLFEDAPVDLLLLKVKRNCQLVVRKRQLGLGEGTGEALDVPCHWLFVELAVSDQLLEHLLHVPGRLAGGFVRHVHSSEGFGGAFKKC